MDKEIEVAGCQETGSMVEVGMGCYRTIRLVARHRVAGETASGCVQSVRMNTYHIHTQNWSLR